MPTPTPLPNYAAYKGLPQLAGLATVAEAAKPGLLVEQCVSRLKRFHYAFKRLHGILTAHITAEPIYELKTGFSHHAYLCAEHVSALRTRVSEMREPPLGLEDVPHPALEAFFDEILCAPTTTERLVGIYHIALPALDAAMAAYEAETNPLTDAPSRRVLRFARLEVGDLLAFGQQALACLVTPDQHTTMSGWTGLLETLLAASESDDTSTPPRHYSKTPHKFNPIPARDERFQDLWNQGVNPEAFLYDDQYPARVKVLMMLYKRIREIDVPEMMAGIIAETTGKPWGYYRDMSRQLWDEARHAMMGEVGFVALGVDWTQCRVSWNWSYRLNTECTPQERHGVLFFIEQGLMPKTGKRYEYETAIESGLPLAATIQDFDWADEVLHSQNGRQWYVSEYGSLQKALEFGDIAWSKILSNWTTVRDQGLTTHENWWPAIYRQACQAAGEQPDERILNYNTTYEASRADLKDLNKA
ncbi:MAG: hypothetical protein ACRC8S_04705 [Fimbriiglobus sp.]